MSKAPWYEVVDAGVPLTQGDLLFDFPVLTWDTLRLTGLAGEPAELALQDLAVAFREDLVVMTQACDLEHGKVENVVLCPHASLTAFRDTWKQWMVARNHNPSEKAWRRTCEDISNGYVWNQAFLAHLDFPEITAEVRVVDFHDVFTIPRLFLEGLLRKRAKSRPRLLAPYREYLSQAFARFFMRVGLPQPIDVSALDTIKAS